jgi:hypothetical protein
MTVVASLTLVCLMTIIINNSVLYDSSGITNTGVFDDSNRTINNSVLHCSKSIVIK